jgi:hypothetical protein
MLHCEPHIDQYVGLEHGNNNCFDCVAETITLGQLFRPSIDLHISFNEFTQNACEHSCVDIRRRSNQSCRQRGLNEVSAGGQRRFSFPPKAHLQERAPRRRRNFARVE